MVLETRSRLQLLGSLVCAAFLGCSSPVEEESPGLPSTTELVPVGGTVTYNGLPLEGAIVVLMLENGHNAVGETNKEGAYQVECFGKPGAPPGNYKIAVSYRLSPDGVAQGLGPRSAMVQAPAMLNSKEMMPAEYSELSRSVLSAVITKTGKSDLNLDLKGPELTRPAPAVVEPTPAEPSQPVGPADPPPAP